MAPSQNSGKVYKNENPYNLCLIFPQNMGKSLFNIKEASCNVPSEIVLDTNILIWAYYPRISLSSIIGKGPLEYQLKYYPEYLEKLFKANSKLYVHELSIFEFIGMIERNEFEMIYCTKKGVKTLGKDYSPNSLRLNYAQEHGQIMLEIEVYLKQIIENFRIKGCRKSLKYLATIMKNWYKTYMDVEDSVIISDSRQFGVNSFLTDDSNFCTQKGIKIYTANDNVICADSLKKKRIKKK